MCVVEKNEILGDIEAVTSLDSYCQTVTCLEPVEAYAINKQSLSKFFQNKSPEMESLKQSVATKLQNRGRRLGKDSVPLFQMLLIQLEDKTGEEERRMFPLLIASRKSLPSKAELFQRLLQAFVNGKASLVGPYVPGGCYLKELMKARAEFRQANMIGTHREKEPWKMLEPLTSRAIKDALKRQEMELESVERTALLKELRKQEAEMIAQMTQLVDNKEGVTGMSSLLTGNETLFV